MTVDELLARYPEQVRATAEAARTHVKNAFRGIDESVDEGAKLLSYGYGPGYKRALCTLILSKTGVKLGIVRGAELPDPDKLMRGEGKVHRHVQLRSPADLEMPGLKPLLKSALNAWKVRTAEAHSKR